MRINDDLAVPVIVHASRADWIHSPAPGVDRRMLFRIGEEKARATSIVRYAPGSSFSAHVHSGGEEFLVLAGTFQDGDGDYPAGSYVRNPPGTQHAPAAKDGATIFVRLWQFRAEDDRQIVRLPGEGVVASLRPGAESARILFDDGHEQVQIERWNGGSVVTVENPAGLELLVISGSMTLGAETLSAQDWARLPGGTALTAETGLETVEVWMKSGPLLHQNTCPF
jgi:anti-sigma factor ChrR (cupin superfamily)